MGIGEGWMDGSGREKTGIFFFGAGEKLSLETLAR